MVRPGDCRMFAVRNRLPALQTSPLSSGPFIRKLHVCHFAKGYCRPRAGAGVARRSGHPRDCRAGVHRRRGAAGWRTAEAFCHRGDLSAALHILHARRHWRVARAPAAAGPRARSDGVDYARRAPDIRRKLPCHRPRCALTGSVSRVDAAGGGVADDGGARAGGGDGLGFDARAGHPRNQHGADSLYGAAYLLTSSSDLRSRIAPLDAWG